jgi:hypothetical protein
MINIKQLILELSGSTSSLASLALTSPKASANSSPARRSPGQVGARLPPYFFDVDSSYLSDFSYRRIR